MLPESCRNVASDLLCITLREGNLSRWAFFFAGTVPKGGALAEGATAAGLRIQYFVENENGPGTYNLLTPEGFRLFDAAVTWALTQK